MHGDLLAISAWGYDSRLTIVETILPRRSWTATVRARVFAYGATAALSTIAAACSARPEGRNPATRREVCHELGGVKPGVLRCFEYHRRLAETLSKPSH